MDNIFWLLILAGATIGLLSTFLVASERELKIKRRRLQELESKLRESPEGDLAQTAVGYNSHDANRINELAARNQELLEEISALTYKLGASEKKVDELQAIYTRLSEVDADNAELRSASRQLEEANKQLQSRLTASESRIDEWKRTDREISDSSGQLQAEIAALKQQLEESQLRVRQLEGSEHKLANATVQESSWRDQQADLEAQIQTLKNEIIASEAKTREMAALQNRLNETELRYQQSSEEKARLEEQILCWQERLAETEESRHRLEIVRARFEELQARQSALAENNRRIQDEMIALDNLLQRSPQNMQQLESPRSSRPAESFLDARRPIHSAANSFAATESDNAGEHTPALQLGEHKMTSSVVPFPGATAEELSAQASRKRKRFGFFIVVLLIFLLAAAMKAGFLRSDPLDRTPPSSAKLETQLYSGTANKGMAHRSQENRLAEARAEPTQRSVANTVAATRSLATKAKDEKEAKIKHKAEKSAGPAWGSYEVLRPVPVYRQPSEGSELLANLDSGMKVNVVDSRGGWLEIRSKHGRPPGFIRAETAVRVGNN